MQITTRSIRAAMQRLSADNTFTGLLTAGANTNVGAIVTPNLSLGALIYFSTWGVLTGGAAGLVTVTISEQNHKINWGVVPQPNAGDPATMFNVDVVNAATYFSVGLWGVVEVAGVCNIRSQVRPTPAAVSISGVGFVQLSALIIP